MSFEQAAAVPIAALTALQAPRDKGHVAARQRVLVNGASDGVGTFAVQLAKWFGAEVTGVCSPRNVETAVKLGADRVIDYTRADFTRDDVRYDLIIDVAGTRSIAARRRALTGHRPLVVVGGPIDAVQQGLPGSSRPEGPNSKAVSAIAGGCVLVQYVLQIAHGVSRSA